MHAERERDYSPISVSLYSAESQIFFTVRTLYQFAWIDDEQNLSADLVEESSCVSLLRRRIHPSQMEAENEIQEEHHH